MFGQPYTKAPFLTRACGVSNHLALGVAIVLTILAALAQLAMQVASSDSLHLTWWLVAMLLAQPGLFLTWMQAQRSLDRYKNREISVGNLIKSGVLTCATFVLLVVLLPSVVELWFWA